MATKLNSITSTGIISIVASTRGITRYCTGLTAITAIASICSVTRIVPSSVVIDEPVRPATISPVSTGPSSRTTLAATVPPTSVSAPKRLNA